MAKITVTLTAQYDDGKTVKEPGDTISIEEKQAKQLAALGMVKLSEDDDASATKPAKKGKGKNAQTAPPADPGDDDPAGGDPDIPDPDDLGDE